MPHALLLGLNDEISLSLARVFKKTGFSLDMASSPEHGRDLLLRTLPDVLVLGQSLTDLGALPGLEAILKERQFSGLIQIHAVIDPKNPAAQRLAERLGVDHQHEAPLSEKRLGQMLRAYVECLDEHTESGEVHVSGRGLLVGESPAMQQVYRLVRKAAISNTSVLVFGESGTGKELVARTIHELSARASQPFVAMNSGAIPESLAESELFGHVKGAFTGAEQARKGFIAQAEGGTLFLDEITEMPLALQVKLLRTLETGEYQPLGSEHLECSDFRLITSCNRDPVQALNEGLLREDLFYRIAQFPLPLPPLRERGEDIHLLAEHFLTMETEHNGVAKAFTAEALDAMRLRDWPGNVRELKNAVARAYMMSGEKIRVEDIPGSLDHAEEPGEQQHSIEHLAGRPLRDVERELILETLEQCGGNKRKTANKLGISPKTLYARLKSFDA